jgi:hypothetical protein
MQCLTDRVDQVVEHLSSEHETWSSNPVLPKKKKSKKNKNAVPAFSSQA